MAAGEDGGAAGSGDGQAPDMRLGEALIDGLLAECRELGEAAVAEIREPAAPPGTSVESLVQARERTRLTARLAHATAWLLARQALMRGDAGADGLLAGPDGRLAGHEVCEAVSEDVTALGEPLRSLMVRSRRLYERLARLDEALATPPSGAGEAQAPAPPH